MNLWLLIPVKPFLESKSRLAPLLDPAQRAALSRQLLENVLTLARQSNLFAHILVISRDKAALEIARNAGVQSLDETGSHQPEIPSAQSHRTGTGRESSRRSGVLEIKPAAEQTRGHTLEAGLNRALSLGRTQAEQNGADAVLVLPADLPLVTPDDLHALIAPVQKSKTTHRATVVLSPSHDGGTNALLLAPPGLIPFAFGPQSFARHRALAQAAGSTVTVVRTPSLLYDLDLPEDLWGEDLGI